MKLPKSHPSKAMWDRVIGLDPLFIEALIRAARMIAAITGTLVVIDSLGIIIRPMETPPHRPKMSALAWLIGGLTVTIAVGFLFDGNNGYVDETDSTSSQVAIFGLYVGLTAMFVTRALTRAKRPALLGLSALGMSMTGVVYTFLYI